MAVALEMVWTEGTTDQYDQVIGKMGLSAEGKGAPGSLFHWVTQANGSIKVTDVWESDEQFQAFADKEIGPYTQEVGLSEPQITRYEVHNYLTAG
jgi:heme-degrading monooxygenase HmoA